MAVLTWAVGLMSRKFQVTARSKVACCSPLLNVGAVGAISVPKVSSQNSFSCVSAVVKYDANGVEYPCRCSGGAKFTSPTIIILVRGCLTFHPWTIFHICTLSVVSSAVGRYKLRIIGGSLSLVLVLIAKALPTVIRARSFLGARVWPWWSTMCSAVER